MKNNTLFIFASLLALFMTGCAQQAKPMYYWNNYSTSLYELKINPGDESLTNHKECLTKIISDSTVNNVRVPPGVYGEYGFICMNEGKKDEAIRYFKLEEETYPESTVLMERLITTAKND